MPIENCISDGYADKELARGFFVRLFDLFAPAYSGPGSCTFCHEEQFPAILAEASTLIDTMIDQLGIRTGDDALRAMFMADIGLCGHHATELAEEKLGIHK